MAERSKLHIVIKFQYHTCMCGCCPSQVGPGLSEGATVAGTAAVAFVLGSSGMLFFWASCFGPGSAP